MGAVSFAKHRPNSTGADEWFSVRTMTTKEYIVTIELLKSAVATYELASFCMLTLGTTPVESPHPGSPAITRTIPRVDQRRRQFVMSPSFEYDADL